MKCVVVVPKKLASVSNNKSHQIQINYFDPKIFILLLFALHRSVYSIPYGATEHVFRFEIRHCICTDMRCRPSYVVSYRMAGDKWQ